MTVRASAQELEPRAYSASPVGTNFFSTSYLFTEGEIIVDPTLPFRDVNARIHNVVPGFSRTFGVFGQTSSVGIAVPIADGEVSGSIQGQRREVDRQGLGDTRMRFSTNWLGGEALSREEFLTQKPTRILGTSVLVVAPTGEYNSERLVNIGTNRWAFKPEVGGSLSLGDFFLESAAGVWVFRDNDQFFGDTTRSQDPLGTFQLHGGYMLSPGLWIAANATYYYGGQTTVGDEVKRDLQANSRFGVTLSIPISESVACKVAWATPIQTRSGGSFSTVGASIQYRWFDVG
jgi:hypothetical protein